MKPWPDDQTLFVKHLRFACQTQCLTVWPHQETLFVKHYLLAESRKCFSTCLRPWQNDQTLLVKYLRLVSQTMFNRLATSKTLFDKQEKAQFVGRCFLKKIKTILFAASKKCLTSKALQYDQTIKNLAWQANL